VGTGALVLTALPLGLLSLPLQRPGKLPEFRFVSLVAEEIEKLGH
jgi:hypothetical protein